MTSLANGLGVVASGGPAAQSKSVGEVSTRVTSYLGSVAFEGAKERLLQAGIARLNLCRLLSAGPPPALDPPTPSKFRASGDSTQPVDSTSSPRSEWDS